MGFTGLLLVGFVLGHMAGNLLIFQGPEALNGYAEFLQEAGHGLAVWIARATLLALFVAHLVLAFQLRNENIRARRVAYDQESALVSGWASRHMFLTGLVILVFVIYHICHFTLGVTDTSAEWRVRLEGNNRPHYVDVYAMVTQGFQNPFVSTFYCLCQLILGLHLWHGASSWFQSLGIHRSAWRRCTSWVGPVLALVVIVGNCSIPVSVMCGLGKSHGAPNHVGQIPSLTIKKAQEKANRESLNSKGEGSKKAGGFSIPKD